MKTDVVGTHYSTENTPLSAFSLQWGVHRGASPRLSPLSRYPSSASAIPYRIPTPLSNSSASAFCIGSRLPRRPDGTPSHLSRKGSQAAPALHRAPSGTTLSRVGGFLRRSLSHRENTCRRPQRRRPQRPPYR